MNIVEHNAPGPFIDLIDEIGGHHDEGWGIVRVKKAHLRPITDEAFLHTIRFVMQDVSQAHAFFIDNKRVFLAWQGEKISVYKQLRALIGATLMQPGLTIDPSVMTAYIDPLVAGKDLKTALKYEGETADQLFEKVERIPLPQEMDSDGELRPMANGSKPSLAATRAQTEQFMEIRNQKPHRNQLQILVVEDQVFSQKLLCEILRSARTRNNNETPVIETVQGIQDAWKVYLKRAPDLVFVDLGLIDGSGHTLARAIKELDTSSFVIIVTANNYEEELSVARQNHVDGFIAKPYNKKQILDCVDRYVGTLKAHTKGAKHGSAG